MGKRRNLWSEKTYRRYLNEGRGSCDLAAYKPCLYTRDFPSKGKVTRIKGLATGRLYLLSMCEDSSTKQWLHFPMQNY